MKKHGLKNLVLKSISFDDIVKREQGNYYIMVGSDCIEINGKIMFSLLEAKEIVKSLIESMEEVHKTSKNAAERERAKEVLETITILPYRIH